MRASQIVLLADPIWHQPIFYVNAMKPFHLQMLLLTDVIYTPKDTHTRVMYKYQNEGLTGCFNPSHRRFFITTLRSDEVPGFQALFYDSA